MKTGEIYGFYADARRLYASSVITMLGVNVWM